MVAVLTPDAFKEARKQLGLNQAELAQVMGYGSNMRVSEIERGVRQPGAAAERLLQAYLAGYRPTDWPD